ncbi:MAG: hypothetical protein ACYS9H_08345 [Planctomycetota bacterium]
MRRAHARGTWGRCDHGHAKAGGYFLKRTDALSIRPADPAVERLRVLINR